jgi:hypothetical protein
MIVAGNALGARIRITESGRQELSGGREFARRDGTLMFVAKLFTSPQSTIRLRGLFL